MSEVKTLTLTCLSCKDRRGYRVGGLQLLVYTNGIHTVHWFCVACREESTLKIQANLAAGLQALGVAATTVAVPLEVLEWPEVAPRISQSEVDMFRRAAHSYFEKQAWRLADAKDHSNDS